MSQCKVSIIIPVYNVENYLRQCIDSIISQDYSDWEVILVNDGSSDCSAYICDEYVAKDSRIRVHHKANSGVSDSRNIGVKMSSGQYVMFLDADDYWLSSNDLSIMISTMEKYQLDVLRGDYQAVDENGTPLFVSHYTEQRMHFAKEIVEPSAFLEKVVCGEFFIVLSIFRKTILVDVEFSTKRSFLEDMDFYSRLLLKPLRLMYMPYKFYAYRNNPNSVSSQINQKKLSDSFQMCDSFDKLVHMTDNLALKHFYRKYSIMMYYWTLDTLSTDPYYEDRFSISRKLNLYNLNKRVRNWSKSYEGAVPLVVKCAPFIGVTLLRCKHTIGYYVRKFKKYAKSFSYRPNL